MAPWIGRLRKGRFQFGGVDYSLPLTFPPHAIHGTTWDRAWTADGSDALYIDLGPDWPFGGKVVQRFALTERSLTLTLEIHAAKEAFPASLGWHPWFKKTLSNGASAAVSFDAAAVYQCDAEQIPTGQLLRPHGGPWDDCFTSLRNTPSITWDDFITLGLHSDTSHWILYDMPADAVCIEPVTAPPNALNGSADIVAPDSPLRATFTLRW